MNFTLKQGSWLWVSGLAVLLVVGPFLAVAIALAGQVAAIDWSLLLEDAQNE